MRFAIQRENPHPRKIPVAKNPGDKNPQIFGLKNPKSPSPELGFLTGDFWGSQISDPYPRDSKSLGIFDLARNEKSPSPISGMAIGDPKKSHPKATSALNLIMLKSSQMRILILNLAAKILKFAIWNYF